MCYNNQLGDGQDSRENLEKCQLALFFTITCHASLPISFEWQKHINRRGPIFGSLGAEVETCFWVRSKAIIDDDKQTLSKDLNMRPLGINLLAQAGYGDWGFYCRYATASLFEKDKGSKYYPFSLCIQWHWKPGSGASPEPGFHAEIKIIKRFFITLA